METLKISTQAMIALIVLSVLCACGGSSPHTTVDIELRFTLGSDIRVEPLTLIPDIGLEIAEYTVTGSGPGGSSFVITTGSDYERISGIETGTWSIIVDGHAESGATIAHGEVSVPIDSEHTEIVVELQMAAGEGDLVLELSVPWAVGTGSGVSASVSASGADAVSLTTTDIGGGRFEARGTLDSGWYLVDVAVIDDDGKRLSGGAAVAVIVPGQITSGLLEIPAPPHEVIDPVFRFGPESFSPPDLQILFDSDPVVFQGREVLFRANNGRIDAPSDVIWYVNGASKGAPSTELSLILDRVGLYRIDAVYSISESPVASATALIESVSPTPYGPLGYVGTVFDNVDRVDGLSAVRDVAIHPSGNVMYVAAYGESSIGVFDIPAADVRPVFREEIAGTDAFRLTGVAALSIASDGGWLAAALSGIDAIGLIKVTADGGLDLSQSLQLDLTADSGVSVTGITDVIMTKDGAFLYACASESSSVVSYTIDRTGATYLSFLELSEQELADGVIVSGPASLEVDASGRWIAVSGASSDSVTIFGLNSASGDLTLAAHFVDGANSVDGLNGGGGLVFGPESTDLYAVGYYDSSVVHLRLDALHGWTFDGFYDDGSDKISGMRYPRDLTIDPSGDWLYVVASGDDSLVVFARNPADGRLSYIATAANESDRIVGLDGARATTAHPESGSVYAVSSNDSALVAFSALVER